MKKAETKAQQIFGKDFENQPVITARPEDTDSPSEHERKRRFLVWRSRLKYQQKLIKRILR